MNPLVQKQIKGYLPSSARGGQSRSVSPNCSNGKEQSGQDKASLQTAQPQQNNEKLLDSHNENKVKRDKQVEQQYRPRWQIASAVVRNNDLSKSPFKKEATIRKTHLSSIQLQQSINKLACSGEFHPESNFKATLQTVFGRRNKNFALEESSISHRGDLETSSITQDENLESFYKEIEKNKRYLESQRKASSVSPMPMSKSLLEKLEKNSKRVEKVYQKVHQQVQNNVSNSYEKPHSQQKVSTPQKDSNEERQLDFSLKNDVPQQASPLQEVNDEEIEDNKKERTQKIKLNTPKRDNLEEEFSIIPFPSPDSNKDTIETATIAHAQNDKNSLSDVIAAKDMDSLHQNGNNVEKQQQAKSTQKSNISTSSGFSFVGKYKKKEISQQQTSLSKIRRKSNETFQGSNQLYQKLQESQRVAQQNMRNMITSPARRSEHSLGKISKKVIKQESLLSERRKVSAYNSETLPKADNDTPSNHHMNPMFLLKGNKQPESIPEGFQAHVEKPQYQNIEQKKQSEKSKIILIKGRRGSKHLGNESKQQDTDSKREVEELSNQNKQKDQEIQRLSQQVQYLTDQMESHQNKELSSSMQKDAFATSSGEKDHLNYHNQDDTNVMFRGSFTPNYQQSYENSEQNSRLEQNNHQEKETYFSAGKNGSLQQRQMSFSVQKECSASEEEQSGSFKDGQDIPIPHTPFLQTSCSQGNEQINNIEISMSINQSETTGDQINSDKINSSVSQPIDQRDY